MILNSNLGTCGVKISPTVDFGKEKVSVDLSVGEHYQKSGENDWVKIQDKLIIPSGSCITIQTKESITMPNDVFGILSTKGSLGAKGIITANTKLDPLFSGELNIPVFNVSGRKVELIPGQAFCSMSFWKTEAPIVEMERRHAIKMQARSTGKIRDFFDRYSSQVVTGVITFLSSALLYWMTNGSN